MTTSLSVCVLTFPIPPDISWHGKCNFLCFVQFSPFLSHKAFVFRLKNGSIKRLYVKLIRKKAGGFVAN